LKRLSHFKTLGCILIGLFFLVSCATREPLPSFYLLTGTGSRTPSSGGTVVFVRRIQVPTYLTTTGLATMKNGIEVQYSATQRWAEPLDQGLSRAVAENLSRNSRIKAYGFSPGASPVNHSYDVSIRLERFEGNDHGEVVLRAHWSISSAGSTEPISSRAVDIRKGGWKPGDYPGLVRLLSKEVTEMSHQIASAIP
jgi:uncharacterized lipoprotein YmbA